MSRKTPGLVERYDTRVADVLCDPSARGKKFRAARQYPFPAVLFLQLLSLSVLGAQGGIDTRIPSAARPASAPRARTAVVERAVAPRHMVQNCKRENATGRPTLRWAGRSLTRLIIQATTVQPERRRGVRKQANTLSHDAEECGTIGTVSRSNESIKI